jgi:hypothetical protein
MVTLGGLLSAGVGFKAFSVMDHEIRWPSFVRGLSFLDCIHVQEFDQHVRGITGDFLHAVAAYPAAESSGVRRRRVGTR